MADGEDAFGGEKLGDPLRIKWRPPAAAYTTARDALLALHDTEEDKLARKAKSLARVAATNVPYHPLVLAGKYHTYRIASRFPIPGGAVQDDRRRAGAYDISTAELVKDAAKVRAEMERQAEAAGIAAELAALRESRALPVRDEDLLPGVAHAKAEEEDASWAALREKHVPKWPRHEAFPAGENEMHLFRMIKEGNIDSFRAVVGRRDLALDASDPSTMRTLLMTACLYGRHDMVELLVKAGAALNKRSDTGNTALHYAFDPAKTFPDYPPKRKEAEAKLTLTVKLLVLSGADVNVMNMQKETPLHSACLLGLATCVHILLTAGASRDAKRWDGRTPADLCEYADANRAWSVRTILNTWDRVKYEERMFSVTREVALRAAHSAGTVDLERERAEAMLKDHMERLNPQEGGKGGRKPAAGPGGGGGGGGGAGSGGAGGSPSKGGAGGILDSWRPDPELEARIPARELLQRWQLYDSWAAHRKRYSAAAGTVQPGSGAMAGLAAAIRDHVEPPLQVAEFDTATGKLKKVLPAEPGSRADFTAAGVVAAAKAAAAKNSKSAGHHAAWFRYGKDGHEMRKRVVAQEQDENDSASVDGIADGGELITSISTKSRKVRKPKKKLTAGHDDVSDDDDAGSTGGEYGDENDASAGGAGPSAGERKRLMANAYRPSTSHGLALAATLRSAHPDVRALAAPGPAYAYGDDDDGGGGDGTLSLLTGADPTEAPDAGLKGFQGGALGMLTGAGAGAGRSAKMALGGPAYKIGTDLGASARPYPGGPVAAGSKALIPSGAAVPWHPTDTTSLLGIASTHNPFSLSLFTGAPTTAVSGIPGGGGRKKLQAVVDPGEGVELHPLLSASGDDAHGLAAKARATARRVAARKYVDAVEDVELGDDKASNMVKQITDFATELQESRKRKPAPTASAAAVGGAGRPSPARGGSGSGSGAAGDGSGSIGRPGSSSVWSSEEGGSAAAKDGTGSGSVGTQRSVDMAVSPAVARRMAVARQLLDDAPGSDYARRFTHIVDDHVVSRKPASMSSVLRASRFRLDGRTFAEQSPADSGTAVMTTSALQTIVVGTAMSGGRSSTRVDAFDDEVLKAPAR